MKKFNKEEFAFYWGLAMRVGTVVLLIWILIMLFNGRANAQYSSIQYTDKQPDCCPVELRMAPNLCPTDPTRRTITAFTFWENSPLSPNFFNGVYTPDQIRAMPEMISKRQELSFEGIKAIFPTPGQPGIVRIVIEHNSYHNHLKWELDSWDGVFGINYGNASEGIVSITVHNSLIYVVESMIIGPNGEVISPGRELIIPILDQYHQE